MNKRRSSWGLGVLASLALLLTACTPTETPATGEAPAGEELVSEREEEAPVSMADEGPVQLTGAIEVSNALIIEVYFQQRYVYLEDLAGYISEDYEYVQPLDAQIFGPVITGDDGTFSYVLNLPAEPPTPGNDVDGDGDSGVAIWQVVMNANLIDDPFIGEFESGGWSTVYTSATIDSENQDVIDGGQLLIWAPDGEQEFPSGFGDDGLLFTDDDPGMSVPAGYSVINLDAEPFEVVRDEAPTLALFEGDIQVNDLSALGWSEAFDALFEKASVEYPFTEMKGIDWDALYAEFAPRVADAEAAADAEAYYLAMRDFAWSIPDGHVGLNGDDFGLFSQETAGGYGFALNELSDGRVIVTYLLEGSPADEAGIEWGAEITEMDGMPIGDAVTAVVPWSSPFSNPEPLRLQQLRYLVRAPIGSETEWAYQNPGGASSAVTLTAVDDDGETFTRTSVFYGADPVALPVEFEVLDSGYGYIAINSFSDDLFITLNLWERAVQNAVDLDLPGLIIDLRQNTGGAPVGLYLAGFFYDGERMDVSRSYYYSEDSGEFETYRPADYLEPDDSLYYGGRLAVLVSTACSSACEDAAWSFDLLEQTMVVGYDSTNGIFGEVGRGQYILPGGYSFQVPTGRTEDMDGSIIIEGPGVVPEVRVPRTGETMRAEYIDGEDVVLDAAVEALDNPLGAGIEPASDPTLDGTRDLVAAAQDGVAFLEDLARGEIDEEVFAAGAADFELTVPLNNSREVIWAAAWCAVDQATLDANLQQIETAFYLNGEQVPGDQVGTLDITLDLPCQFRYLVVSDWVMGEHELITETNFIGVVNDGIETYQPGIRRTIYRVYVAR